MLEFISEIARIVQVGLSVILLGGVAIAYYSWRSKQNLDRRVAAVGYSLTKNQKYFEARGKVSTRFRDKFKAKQPIELSEIRRMVENSDEVISDIRYILSHWEIMAISVFEQTIDHNTCFEMVGSTLVDTVDVLMNYIIEARRQPENRRRYDYLLILHDIWTKRLEEEQRQGPISRFDQFVKLGRDPKLIERPLSKDASPIGRSLGG